MIQIGCIKHTLNRIMKTSHQKDDSKHQGALFQSASGVRVSFWKHFLAQTSLTENPNPTRRVHPNLGEVFSTEFGPTKNAKVEHSSSETKWSKPTMDGLLSRIFILNYSGGNSKWNGTTPKRKDGPCVGMTKNLATVQNPRLVEVQLHHLSLWIHQRDSSVFVKDTRLAPKRSCTFWNEPHFNYSLVSLVAKLSLWMLQLLELQTEILRLQQDQQWHPSARHVMVARGWARGSCGWMTGSVEIACFFPFELDPTLVHSLVYYSFSRFSK